MKDLNITTKPLMHFTNYGSVWRDSFMIFCKTIPQTYDEGKNDPQ